MCFFGNWLSRRSLIRVEKYSQEIGRTRVIDSHRPKVVASLLHSNPSPVGWALGSFRTRPCFRSIPKLLMNACLGLFNNNGRMPPRPPVSRPSPPGRRSIVLYSVRLSVSNVFYRVSLVALLLWLQTCRTLLWHQRPAEKRKIGKQRSNKAET